MTQTSSSAHLLAPMGELRIQLAISGADKIDDDALAMLLRDASARVRNYVGRADWLTGEEDTIPDDVQSATLITARALFFDLQRGDPALRSESESGIGGSSWAPFEGALPHEATAMLNRYRAPGLS